MGTLVAHPHSLSELFELFSFLFRIGELELTELHAVGIFVDGGEDLDAEVLTVLGILGLRQRKGFREGVLLGQVECQVVVVDAYPSVTVSAIGCEYCQVDGAAAGEYAAVVTCGDGEACWGDGEVGIELHGPHIAVVAWGDGFILEATEERTDDTDSFVLTFDT